jgi:Holliday junction resolvase RusA-like endonuclease
MTQRDKWAKRPAVLRYRAFCDEVRLNRVSLPEAGARIEFHIPMPKSWSKKKRKLMDGKPHQQKPDLDNLIKALGDSIHAEDCGIYDLSACKRWAETGAITIKEVLIDEG